MAKGGYNGGSTVIGPGSRGWFGSKKPGRPSSRLKPKAGGNKQAVEAAVLRHREQLEIERYRLLADVLRKEDFSESEIRRGLQMQRRKDRMTQAGAAPKHDRNHSRSRKPR